MAPRLWLPGVERTSFWLEAQSGQAASSPTRVPNPLAHMRTQPTYPHRFGQWLQAHIQASAEVVGKPFVLEEWGKQWSEQQRNEMFRLVQASSG